MHKKQRMIQVASALTQCACGPSLEQMQSSSATAVLQSLFVVLGISPCMSVGSTTL